MDCYFLPLSNCQAPAGKKDNIHKDGEEHQSYNVNGGPNTWLRDYMMRPRQWVRRRIYDLLKTVPPMEMPCSVLHVRRTDAILEPNWRKNRNYFPLSDYLARVPSTQKSIVLLTDDHSTMEEAHEFHPTVPWIYINRTRYRGIRDGYNAHIPSGDPVWEMVVILAELKLASSCRHLVHTRSGFKEILLQKMQIQHENPKLLTVHKIDMGRQPNSTHNVSVQDFFHKLHARRVTTTTTTTTLRE